MAEHCKQTDNCMWQPAHREPHKEDENCSEGPGFETHVHFDLWWALQSVTPHFTDLIESWQAGVLAGVVVDANGVAPHCVEDAYVRVEHDREWHEEN